jgi:hypothetical protein
MARFPGICWPATTRDESQKEINAARIARTALSDELDAAKAVFADGEHAASEATVLVVAGGSGRSCDVSHGSTPRSGD